MANIQKIPQPSYKYLLELTEEEAQVVFDLVSHVTGCWDYSRRKHSDKIYDVMKNEFTAKRHDLKASIWFEEIYE